MKVYILRCWQPSLCSDCHDDAENMAIIPGTLHRTFGDATHSLAEDMAKEAIDHNEGLDPTDEDYIPLDDMLLPKFESTNDRNPNPTEWCWVCEILDYVWYLHEVEIPWAQEKQE